MPREREEENEETNEEDGSEEETAYEDGDEETREEPREETEMEEEARLRNLATSRRGRPRRRGVGKPRGRIPPNAEDPREADLMWPIVIERLGRDGLGADAASIRIARNDAGREITMGSIPGDYVKGDSSHSPGEALFKEITDRFHLGSPNRGPVE